VLPLASGLLNLLAAAGQDQRLLLVLDDVHFGDQGGEEKPADRVGVVAAGQLGAGVPKVDAFGHRDIAASRAGVIERGRAQVN